MSQPTQPHPSTSTAARRPWDAARCSLTRRPRRRGMLTSTIVTSRASRVGLNPRAILDSPTGIATSYANHSSNTRSQSNNRELLSSRPRHLNIPNTRSSSRSLNSNLSSSSSSHSSRLSSSRELRRRHYRSNPLITLIAIGPVSNRQTSRVEVTTSSHPLVSRPTLKRSVSQPPRVVRLCAPRTRTRCNSRFATTTLTPSKLRSDSLSRRRLLTR